MKSQQFRRIIALSLCMSLLLCCVPAYAAETNDNNVTNGTTYSYTDENGDVITSTTIETPTGYVVNIYVNGELTQHATTDIDAEETTLTMYEDGTPILANETYDLNAFVSDVTIESEEIIGDHIAEPAVELFPTTSYDIYNRYRTDYLYQGSILYGDTYTRGYEISRQNRYEDHYFEFGIGTAASVVLSALLLKYRGALTLKSLLDLGVSTSAGVLIDTWATTACFTEYSVSTKVYFDDIYTVIATNIYDKVIVAAGAQGIDHYTTDYYDYDIIWSWSSYCCSSGAVAFYDKYISGNNPSLTLPIRSIPYYGY